MVKAAGAGALRKPLTDCRHRGLRCDRGARVGSARIGDGTRKRERATLAWWKPASGRLRHTQRNFMPGNRLLSLPCRLVVHFCVALIPQLRHLAVELRV